MFRFTTFGESHGPLIGVVVDGMPSGIEISEEEMGRALLKRRPGGSYTSQRKEEDIPEIVSGVFEGKTTGAPIAVLIRNNDVKKEDYAPFLTLYRPGHANFTYRAKYGHFDPYGGGRASARETACRTVAGVLAKKLLGDVEIVAYLKQVGPVLGSPTEFVAEKVDRSPIFALDREAEMIEIIEKVRGEGDSIGGIVECIVLNVPKGLGDPVYEKLEANLGRAMLSIPAVKGVEFGEGFAAALMRGSEHNDSMKEGGRFVTNRHGGILGGISTGEPIVFRVVFKPASSIAKPIASVHFDGTLGIAEHPRKSRHDPCVAIRGVKVVEAMAAVVLADAIFYNALNIGRSEHLREISSGAS